VGREKQSSGSRLPPLSFQDNQGLSSALLTALLATTALLAATTALLATLFFALTLLAFTFLFLAILLLATLLSRSTRFAWFVWILLSFHITFRCYMPHFSLVFDWSFPNSRSDPATLKSPPHGRLALKILLLTPSA
jgi:hypothetical protein